MTLFSSARRTVVCRDGSQFNGLYEHAIRFCLDRSSPVKSVLLDNEIESNQLYWTSEKWLNSAQVIFSK